MTNINLVRCAMSERPNKNAPMITEVPFSGERVPLGQIKVGGIFQFCYDQKLTFFKADEADEFVPISVTGYTSSFFLETPNLLVIPQWSWDVKGDEEEEDG